MDGTSQADGEHHDRNHVDSEVPMQDLIDRCVHLISCAAVGRGPVHGT